MRSGSGRPTARAAGLVVSLIQPAQFDAALEVWRAASLRRGRPGHGPRVALARALLTRRDSPVYVALSPRVTGFIVIEPAAADRHPAHDRAEAMEISMLFAHRRRNARASAPRCFGTSSPSLSRKRFASASVDRNRHPQAQQFYRSLAMIPTGQRVQGAGSARICR